MEMKVLYKALPFFVFFMLLSPSLALAVNCDSNCQYVWKGLFGFDTAWLNEPRQLVINVILPSLAIFVIFLGVFRAIGLNRMMGNMEYAIALVVMFAALFSGWVNAINTYALAALGQFAFWAFFSMFGVGVVFYWIGYYRNRKAEAGLEAAFLTTVNHINRKIKFIAIEIEKENAKLAKTTNEDKREKILKRITDLNTELKEYEKKRNELNRSYVAVPPNP